MTFLWKTSSSERGNFIFTARDAEEALLRWTAGRLWRICACRTTQLESHRCKMREKHKRQRSAAYGSLKSWTVASDKVRERQEDGWLHVNHRVVMCHKLQQTPVESSQIFVINSALRCLHVVSVSLLWCPITCRPHRNCWGFFFYLALFQSHLFRKQHPVHTPASLGLLKGPLSLMWPIHYNCLLQIGSHADEGDVNWINIGLLLSTLTS